MKKEVIIFIHGFKQKDINDFDVFVKKYESNFKDKEFVIFDYYSSTDLDTINEESFDKRVIEVLDKYKDRKVKIISYSFGTAISMKNLSSYDNIKDIYLIAPSFYVYTTRWIKSIYKFKKKNKKLEKKLGKERYESLKKQIGGDIKFREISKTISKYIKNNRKYFKETEGKNIIVTYSKNDEVAKNKKMIKYINKNMSKNNNITFNKVDEDHFKILNNENNIKHIENFINDKV